MINFESIHYLDNFLDCKLACTLPFWYLSGWGWRWGRGWVDGRGWRQFKIEDHFSPPEVEIRAELGKKRTYDSASISFLALLY